MNNIIAITPGEPSGIGPDITLKSCQKINSGFCYLRYRTFTLSCKKAKSKL